VIGWLLDTNVVSTIINPNGAPTVKTWAATQDEGRLFLSILTLGEYEKGIHNVPDDDPNRPRFIAAGCTALGCDLGNDQAVDRALAAGDRHALRGDRARTRPLLGNPKRQRCANERRPDLRPME